MVGGAGIPRAVDRAACARFHWSGSQASRGPCGSRNFVCGSWRNSGGRFRSSCVSRVADRLRGGGRSRPGWPESPRFFRRAGCPRRASFCGSAPRASSPVPTRCCPPAPRRRNKTHSVPSTGRAGSSPLRPWDASAAGALSIAAAFHATGPTPAGTAPGAAPDVVLWEILSPVAPRQTARRSTEPLRERSPAPLLSARNEKRELFFVNLSQLLKLHEVHTTFAKLAFRDEGVGLTELLCNLHLGQTGILAGLNEASDEFAVCALIRLILGIHT